MNACQFPSSVERWYPLEITLMGPSHGNPFTEQSIEGVFAGEHETVKAMGFYDGDGVYKVRFMPRFTGAYRFEVKASFSGATFTGEFSVSPATEKNHGPVHVNGTHFAYEDGMAHYSVGTTCYAWTHQKEALQEETLESLKNSPFNKIRFCVFPKSYDYNYWDPVTFPYEGTPCDCSGMNKLTFKKYFAAMPGNQWDFSRLNPKHFQNFENRIADLMELGVEADIIVMHPYDRWGFSRMSREEDDLYWNYVIARFSAFRNVWWSLANEYDLMPTKTIADWERWGAMLVEKDPYHHLRSVHNCFTLYDFSRPWITHCSIQRQAGNKELDFIPQWLNLYQKPVVIDEMCYEGNINPEWGNISAQEMSHRCWMTAISGGYPGHGETYEHPDNILWWSHGGTLHGESPSRIAFLKKILEEIPGGFGLRRASEHCCAILDKRFTDEWEYRLYYYGQGASAFKMFDFGEGRFRVEIIDTWNMTVTDIGVHTGTERIDLPGRPYMALRVRRVKG